MHKNIVAAVLVLMMGSVMSGCYFDPFYNSGYSNGHSNGDHERSHERKHHD